MGFIDRLRAGLDAYNATGELPPMLLSPDFELHQADSIVDTEGVFRGPTAFRKTLAELEESFEDLRFEGEEFLEAPGGEVVVVVRVCARGRGSGMEVDNRVAWVWTHDGGMATGLVVYEEPDQALEAVGLERGPGFL